MITVLGLGFVGLTTGLGFSKKGFKTYGIDINTERLNMLKNYEIPFHEPHLKEVLEENLGKTFLLDRPFEEAIKNSEAIFICVGTPAAPDGSADLKYILSAIDQILDVEDNKFKVIITKSTVPPSTVTKKVKPYVEEKLSQLNRDVGFASNPEFLREGFCWEDFIEPDRIVLGVEDERSKTILNKIYEPFNAPIRYVSYNSAEFIKYLSNTLLSTLISYSNEMSMIADGIGDINIPEAFKILHEDKRWFGSPAGMSSYVYPGCGYGGYCLPKDTSALNSIAIENGVDTQVLKGNLKINETIKEFVAGKITKDLNVNENIGILGLSFKPDSDDVRLTPSKDVIQKLLDRGYHNIYAYDPIAIDVFKNAYPEIKITFIDNLDEILDKCDNVAILTGWKEFKLNKEKISAKNVFDFRYIY